MALSFSRAELCPENVAAAIARQFGRLDDTNQMMWLWKN